MVSDAIGVDRWSIDHMDYVCFNRNLILSVLSHPHLICFLSHVGSVFSLTT
uniref:Uncharacterized protein n=1 Tax=Anguilla anguilla TaxID=7936 RepID=A0A0E9QBN3_ANGAN